MRVITSFNTVCCSSNCVQLIYRRYLLCKSLQLSQTLSLTSNSAVIKVSQVFKIHVFIFQVSACVTCLVFGSKFHGEKSPTWWSVVLTPSAPSSSAACRTRSAGPQENIQKPKSSWNFPAAAASRCLKDWKQNSDLKREKLIFLKYFKCSQRLQVTPGC